MSGYYAIVIIAQKGANVFYRPGTVIAASKEEAIGKGYEWLSTLYPHKKGYINYNVDVVEIGAKNIIIAAKAYGLEVKDETNILS